MPITKTELKEIYTAILEDFPKPKLIHFLLAGAKDEEEAIILAKFIKEKYNEKEIREGLEEFSEYLRKISQFFGGLGEGNAS